MDINYTAIGVRIRDARKSMGITQAQLGELAQVEPSNVSHIERGATKVSLPTLLRIANALQVSLDHLVYDSISHSAHISEKELEILLKDCTNQELKAIVKMVSATKTILRDQ